MSNKNNREGDNVIQLFPDKAEFSSTANVHTGYTESAAELLLALQPNCRLNCPFGEGVSHGMQIREERKFSHREWIRAIDEFRLRFKRWSATATDDDLWCCLSLVDADKLDRLGDTPEEIVAKLRIALDVILGDIIGSESLAKFMKLGGVTPNDLMTAFDDDSVTLA